MSASYHIVLDETAPGFDALVEGIAILANVEVLNAIAADLRVTPLREFLGMDVTEAADRMEDEGDPLHVDVVDTDWFEASDGLKTFRTLLVYVEEHPSVVQDADKVINELTDFEDVLEQAEDAELKWRLATGA
jgi:hypothetical protein